MHGNRIPLPNQLQSHHFDTKLNNVYFCVTKCFIRSATSLGFCYVSLNPPPPKHSTKITTLRFYPKYKMNMNLYLVVVRVLLPLPIPIRILSPIFNLPFVRFYILTSRKVVSIRFTCIDDRFVDLFASNSNSQNARRTLNETVKYVFFFFPNLDHQTD